MKMFAPEAPRFGVVQLPEAGIVQATVALEMLPLVADNWPGGDGCEFVLSIGLVKCSMGNSEAAQAI
jgi:hypothetical protein